MTVQRTIARNTIFNSLGRIFEGVLGLVLTWYIVDLRLGPAAWGLWSLVAVFTSYAALLDFGVASGFTKYIAEHHARGERQRLSAVVSTGVFFYAALGVVLVPIGWFVIDALMDSVIAPYALDRNPDAGEHLADLHFLLQGGLVLFAVNNCFAPLAAVPTGLQRMGLTNILGLVATLAKIVLTVYFIESGHGVRGLLYTNGLVLAGFGIASGALAFWLLPGLRISPLQVSRKAFDALFAFGWRTQVAKLSNLINFQTDRIVVAAVFSGGLGLVGVYALGEQMAGRMRQLPALLVSALTPAASDLDARGEHERLQRLYLLSTKYMAAAAIPLAIYFCLMAEPIMRAWLSGAPRLDIAAWVMRILCVGYLVNLLPGPGVSLALGKGHAGETMIAGLISMFANVVFTVLLYGFIGFYGIPIATSLGMAISTWWFFGRMRDLLGIGMGELIRRAFFWPTMACVPGGILAGALALWAIDLPGHLLNLGVVVVGAAVFFPAYGLCLRITPFLDAFDIDFLEHTLKLGRIPGFQLLTRRYRDG